MNENTQFVHISKNSSHNQGSTIEEAFIVDGKKVSYRQWLDLTAQAENELGLAWHKRVSMVQYNIGPTERLVDHVQEHIF